jgi:Ca2+-binding EF-hand superfamily protein
MTYGMYLLMCLFFLHKSRRIITGRDCDIHNSSSIIGISLFFVQTIVLLPSQTFGDLSVVTELAGAVSMSPDTPDQTDGKCISTGQFYSDWLLKFSIPTYNVCATVCVVFLAGLWKRAPWQGKMALFFAVQSSLFAINLRAISLFFCRDDLSPSVGHLKVDPSQSCSTSIYRTYLVFAWLIFATFALALPAVLCKQIRMRMDAHAKLLRIEAYLKYGFDQGAAVLQSKEWQDSHSAEYAARDHLSVIYYPLRRQRYWWAVVWIVRPTAIAIIYNSRNRRTGVAFGLADWRILVVLLLMLYNCLQATVRPFKHLNESQLDSFSVLLLMSLFTVSINNDFVTVVDSTLKETTSQIAQVMTAILLCLVLFATAHSKNRTAANIKRMIARDRWKTAWQHMSGDECDPLADVGKLVEHLEIEANKKTGVLAKIGQIGIAGVKLPVFEQIDIDASGTISLHEFLDWWTIRTIRTGMVDEMREVAADLFAKFDRDKSGEVDREEFDEILIGLREWHAKQKALMSQFDEPPEARKQRIRLEREKVVENLHKHGWTESPSGWVRPEIMQPGTGAVAGMVNPLASAFEVESPVAGAASATAPPVSTKLVPAARPPTVEEIFACIDSDRSGSVSFHEFSTWWTSHGGAGSLLELAKRAFDIVSLRDGSSSVNIHGLKDIMIAVAAESWEQHADPASGRQYFVNPATGATSWLAPGIDAVAPFLERAGISREAATATVYTPTLTEIFEEIDENASGIIEFDEFADWWEQNGGSQVTLAMAQEAFVLVEMRDGTPGLGFDELKEVLIAVASDDWEEAVDQTSGRKYFIDPHTKSTTWLVPGVEIVGPFLQRAGITRNGVRPAVRTRSAVRGPASRRQTIDMRSQPAEQRHGEPTAVLPMQSLPVEQRHVDPAAVLPVERERQALVNARMVDHVIATLDIAGTGQVLQSTFATWWRSHQVPGLSVMEKLKFSRPISKHFLANGGALSTMQFRELLRAMFEKEVKSGNTTELDAEQMNAWLQRLLQF